MIRIGSLIILCLLCFSCVNENDLYGTYMAKKFGRTVDTLILKEENFCEHKVYNKTTGDLIISNSSSWELDEGRVVLNNFRSNKDDILFDSGINNLSLKAFLNAEGIFKQKNYYLERYELLLPKIEMRYWCFKLEL